MAVVAWPALVGAQTLPLVVERGPEGAVAYWWSEGTPQSTPLSEALLAALGSGGLDPAAPGAPRVSQVYRIPNLSETSARNLGRLFGATGVLAGTAEERVLGPVAGDLLQVAEVTVEARWLAVGADLTWGEVREVALGGGRDVPAALADARQRAAAQVVAELERRRSAAPGLGEGPVAGPVLLVHEPTSATPLVALLGELRARDTVVADLREAWATEGAVAYAVTLAPGAPVSALDSVLDALATDPSWGYQLERLGGDGLVREVRVGELPPPEVPEPALPAPAGSAP